MIFYYFIKKLNGMKKLVQTQNKMSIFQKPETYIS